MKKIQEYVDELCAIEGRLFEIANDLNLDFCGDSEIVQAWYDLYELVKDYEREE